MWSKCNVFVEPGESFGKGSSSEYEDMGITVVHRKQWCICNSEPVWVQDIGHDKLEKPAKGDDKVE